MGFRKINIICYSVLWILLLLCFHKGHAQVESYQQMMHGKIKKGDTLIIKDEKFRNSSYEWSSINNKLVTNIVTFGLYGDAVYSIEKSFKCELDLKIEYWSQPDQEDPITIEHAKLNINYDTVRTALFQAETNYEFLNAYKIKLTVNNISSKELGNELPGIFMLRGKIVVDRQYTSKKEESLTMTGFLINNDGGVAAMGKVAGAPVINAAPAAGPAPAPDMINVNWNEIIPGQEYDLEWAYVDEESDNGRLITANRATITDAQLAAMFRFNATRITTDKHNYDVTLLHSSKYLLFRIRYVLYVDGFRDEHPWQYGVNLTGGTFVKIADVDWHQPALNWQFSATYAEGGKKKEIVSYFDGTLRNRQIVTVNNTDKKVILQENLYDEFGRVAANILPAPIDASVLKYYDGQHLNTNKNVYTFRDLYNNNSNGLCVVKPAPIDSSVGASQYYSQSNPFLGQDPYTAWVPNAGRYPFAVTAYTNDNTGRIRVQGGVGETMQPNQEETLNHTTRYFYGKPVQWELNRLFGPDAGKASHFLKNMVIDPNGQISISYLNSSGKPVATALSGGAPDNVLPLNTKGVSEQVDMQVLEPSSFVFDQQELKLKGTTTYLCAVPDPNTRIKYRIDKLIKRYQENNVTICSNCYYELKINIYDDCNNKVDANVTPIKIGSTVADCNAGGYTENSFVVNLGKAGEYTLSFELSLNPDVMNAYTEEFIAKNTNLRPEFSYIIAQLRRTDFSGCYSDCHNCEAALGTKTGFQQNVRQRLLDNKVSVTQYATEINSWSSGLYDALLANCKSVQVNCIADPCDGLRKTMKQDVSPGGQYAQFDSYGNTLEEDINVLNRYFRTKFPKKLPGDPVYEQAKFYNREGILVSPYDETFTVKDLVNNWKSEWADLFLEFHPEYCALVTCQILAPLKQWDEKVKSLCLKASDIPIYLGGATYNPSNPSWLSSIDPFTTHPTTKLFASFLQARINGYSRNTAPFTDTRLNSKNLSQYVDYLLYCSDSTGNTNSSNNGDFIYRWNNCTPVTQCRVVDREWDTYAGLYFQLKEKIYQTIRDSYCADACKIGRPESFIPGNCPSVGDFDVTSDTLPCSAGLQSVLIAYEGKPLTTPARVVITYANTVLQPSVLIFNPGDRRKNLCVSGDIPVSWMKVDEVSCGSEVSPTYPPKPPVELSDCGVTFTPVITGGGNIPMYQLTLTNISGLREGITYTFKVTVLNSSGGGTNMRVSSSTSSEVFTFVVKGPVSSNPTINFGGSIIPEYAPRLESYTVTCSDPFTGCSPLYRNKISRLDRIDYNMAYSSNKDSLRTDGIAQIKRMVQANCEANADLWMKQLADVLINYSSDVKDKLRQRLIDVCKSGADSNHITGASAGVPEPTVEGYTSFKEVMLGVLGSGSLNMERNPWILGIPYPYNVKAQTTDVVIAASSPAICTRLAVLQSDYNAQGAGRTFFKYLSDKYGRSMVLSQDELDQLVKSCSNCRFLIASAIKLPVFMDPDPKAKGCINATDFNNGMAALRAESISIGYDTAQINYELVVTTYLNHRWGFSLGYVDYRAYMDKILADPNALLCNSPVYSSVAPDPFGCMAGMLDGAVAGGRRRYIAYIDSVKQDFRTQYVNVCAGTQATVNLKTMQQLYHFTLYYYDQSGSLVRTVPPEGVDIMSNARMDNVAGTIPPDFTCNYNGPTQNTALSGILGGLTAALNKTDGVAIEMWIKGRTGDAPRVITPTSNNEYYVTTCVNKDYCYVTIYKTAATGTSLDITNSKQIAVPMSNYLNGGWTHVVVQGSDLMNGMVDLYVNGELLMDDPNAPPAPCEWSIESTATQLNITTDLNDLKHLRTYNRPLTGDEVWANSQEPCMSLVAGQSALTLWARYNAPANGAPGTVGGPSSNVEPRPLPAVPLHRLTTDYAYTSLNQVVAQKSPDGGVSNFWFDYLGRTVAAQNAKQAGKGNIYSYTIFDALGRITEVGESAMNTSLPTAGFYTSGMYANLYGGTKSEYVQTIYDLPFLPSLYGTQENLISRVSHVTHAVKRANGAWALDRIAYSYDLMGNAKSIWHSGLMGAYAKTEYNYDLISGNVNTVLYHPGQNDQFYYGYDYDAENRVVTAKSGIKGASLDRKTILEPVTDAAYRYYKHGPLAKIELGKNSVQGMDYAYTIQGWLKGMNGNYLLPDKEMGKDGNAGSGTSHFGKDVVSYSLDYFQGDYTPINKVGVNPFALTWSSQASDVTGHNLYNGNIARSVVSSQGINNGAPVGYSYRYDQLNRLRTMRQHALTTAAITWGTAQQATAYAEDITYDANGNILTYNRNGIGGTPMDRLTYMYPRTTDNMLSRNRLRYVKDAITAPVYPGVDISDQHAGVDVPSETGNHTDDNYKYDEIGNLISDGKEKIAVEWNVFGKISKISKETSDIEYFYDANNNRTAKVVTDRAIPAAPKVTTTHYERDAKGSTLATYDQNGTETDIIWKEQSLYGSSRLGVWKPNMKLSAGSTKDGLWTAVNNRDYEITNHLGNVLATVSDNNVASVATVTSAVDYSPFGMQLVGRKMNGGGYRYGFNGKENDNEVKGEGNQQDYGMRIYDPRIGKFLSVDPITKDYPELTPYQFASNKPINSIDLDGLESWEITTPVSNLRAALQVSNVKSVYNDNQRRISEANRLNEVLRQSRNNPQLSRSNDCIGCRAIANEQYAYNKEMESRASLDPISYGGPNMGQGLARDPFVQASATGVLTGGIVSTFSTGFVANTTLGQFGLKAGLDVIGQTVANGGDLSKTDLLDATLAGVGKPIFSAFAGAAIDVKPFNAEKRWSLVMYNKSFTAASLDLGQKILFGGSKYGLGGQVKAGLKKPLEFQSDIFTRPLGASLTTTYNTLLSFPISVAGKVARKAVKAKTGE